MNDRVKINGTEILSKKRYLLKSITYDYKDRNGKWVTLNREIYDRGDAATIFLYNKELGTVILTRQLRLPTYVNGNPSGMLLETCAGKLDNENAEDCIKRETEEETGYKVTQVRKVLEAYMSPGSLTEKMYFFVAEYSKEMKISKGGGLEIDHEDIEVLEINITEAMAMIENGEIKDAKTIMLLYYATINKLL